MTALITMAQPATMSFGAQISSQALGNTISYYITATDSVGLVTTDPANAPTSQYSYTVRTAAPIESWRLQDFQTTYTYGNLADTASYSGDGTSNLMKYALGLSPLIANNSISILPSIVTNSTNSLLENRLSISLTIPNPAPSDVTYNVQTTADLLTWTTVATKVGTGVWSWNPTNYPTSDGNTSHIVDSGGTPDNVYVGDLVPSSGNPRRFMRLQVAGP